MPIGTVPVIYQLSLGPKNFTGFKRVHRIGLRLYEIRNAEKSCKSNRFHNLTTGAPETGTVPIGIQKRIKLKRVL